MHYQILSTLSQEIKPADPALQAILKDLSIRKKKKTSAGNLLSSISSGSLQEGGQTSDGLDSLLIPFVTILYEALGETAVRCEDLGMMLDLVKCKPYFLKKLCLIIVDWIEPDRRKVILNSLFNTSNQRYTGEPKSAIICIRKELIFVSPWPNRDETNALLDYYVKQEMISLLQEIDVDVAEKEQRESSAENDDIDLTIDDRLSSVHAIQQNGERTEPSYSISSLYSTSKLEVLSSWLAHRPHQTEQETALKTEDPRTADDRELRLQMVDAIPSVLHLDDVNGLRYFQLLIDLLLAEEDNIVIQTLTSKLQNLSYNAIVRRRR